MSAVPPIMEGSRPLSKSHHRNTFKNDSWNRVWMSSGLRLWRKSQQVNRSLYVNTQERIVEQSVYVAYRVVEFCAQRADSTGSIIWSSSHLDIFVESQLWNTTGVPTIREIRDTIEIPLVRFIDKDGVDDRVGCSDKCLMREEIPHVHFT